MKTQWKWLLVLVSMVLGALVWEVSRAEAQVTGPTLEERRTVALEKIASEMSRMRREKCR